MDRNRALWVGMAGVGLLAAAIVVKKLTGSINPLQDVVKNTPPPEMPSRKPASHARGARNGTAKGQTVRSGKPA